MSSGGSVENTAGRQCHNVRCVCRILSKLIEFSGFSILVILSYCSGTVCRLVSFVQPILIRVKIFKRVGLDLPKVAVYGKKLFF